MSGVGLGCAKTRRRGKLIEQLSFRIAIRVTTVSERCSTQRDACLVRERAVLGANTRRRTEDCQSTLIQGLEIQNHRWSQQLIALAAIDGKPPARGCTSRQRFSSTTVSSMPPSI
jgi:hypothetical protein